jgi:crotonobetainyl-CoA:carnitine CoA-transferase CaiB-like acyl-CoA transferase
LIDYLAVTFRTRSRDAWVQFMADVDVAFAPVLDFAEALAAPHVAERGLLVTADGRPHIAPAIRFGSDDWRPSPVPPLGGG